ncbi:MAG: GNAT family N-acetyltransferase, partial [Chloroflexia bacterium]|nr:GNAT family N-acetyltransferase [Chloroflexia bacterium]
MTPESPGDHNSARSTIGVLVRAGARVDLRRHVPEDRDIFVGWYQDAVIAEMLRHDLAPLTSSQARRYFDSIILPATARGTCWAIFEHGSDRLIGSTALVDIDENLATSLFRLVIGDKEKWGQGYGTEATDLVMAEAFLRLSLRQVNLEVFAHNPRAQRA